MKKQTIRTISISLLLLFAFSCNAHQPDNINTTALKGDYFGEVPPLGSPKIFAKGELNKYDMIHGKITFAPNGKEIYWESNAGSSMTRWIMSQGKNGEWLPAGVSFLDVKLKEGGLSFSYDGQRVYYHSRRLTEENSSGDKNIWYREKTNSGWSEPFLLNEAINSPSSDDWCFTIARDNTVYFVREGAKKNIDHSSGEKHQKNSIKNDIYMSRWENGKYSEPVRLDFPVNSDEHELNCVISPDNDYIIFNSRRQGNYKGFVGLFVSFRNDDDSWSEAVCLDPIFGIDNCYFPSITPDGKYLFFAGGMPVNGSYSNSHYYWINTEFIKNLNPNK